MAISTYKVFLMHSDDGETYEKLVNIKEFPDLGGDPDVLETTTTSHAMQTFIMGIQTNDALAFTANYDKDDYQALKALEHGEEFYAVWFGGEDTASGVATPTGEHGIFAFKGEIATHVVGGGVNEVVDMSVTIAPTTPIDFSLPEAVTTPEPGEP